MAAIQQMLAAYVGGTNDPYWANVVALLHMDGTNGSTTFTDSSGKHTFTASGNAQVSTAQSKFGGASGLFDGTGDYVSTGDSVDFTLGTGDWTIEHWVKTTGNTMYTFGQCDAVVDPTTVSAYSFITATGTVRIGYYTGSSPVYIDSTATVNNGNWHHVACVRYGGVLTIYIDGTGISRASETGSINDSATAFTIGRVGDYSLATFNGNMDEFRLTKGVARYTANFTPPTAAFPNF